MTDEQVTEWCAGMPMVQRRPLTGAERQELQGEERRLRLSVLGILLLHPLLWAIFVLGVINADPQNEIQQGILAVSGILPLAIGLPVLILLVRDKLRLSKGLRGDLAGGFVKRFQGASATGDREDQTLHRLNKMGLFPREGRDQWWMEGLPESRRIWRVPAGAVPGWMEVRSVQVAQTPAAAAIAAEWLEPLEVTGEEPLLAGRRDLSPAEQDEVRRTARGLWKRPLPYAIGLTIWLSMALMPIAAEGKIDGPLPWVRFAVLAAAALYADATLVMGLMTARRLGQDADGGQVMIFSQAGENARSGEPHPGTDPEDDSEEGTDSTDQPRIAEVLPVSQWVWTEDGKAAPWRKVPS